MLENTISIEGRTIRTDWIYKIQRRKENGTLTCTIWLSVGPVGVYSFEGSAAKTALDLLSNHAALQAYYGPCARPSHGPLAKFLANGWERDEEVRSRHCDRDGKA